MFGNWGTIGSPSFFRRVKADGSPVGISVFSPPSGPVNSLYQKYIEAGIQNTEFIKTFLDGLRNSDAFTNKDSEQAEARQCSIPYRRASSFGRSASAGYRVGFSTLMSTLYS